MLSSLPISASSTTTLPNKAVFSTPFTSIERPFGMPKNSIECVSEESPPSSFNLVIWNSVGSPLTTGMILPSRSLSISPRMSLAIDCSSALSATGFTVKALTSLEDREEKASKEPMRSNEISKVP